MSHAHIASLSELADQVAEQGWVVTEPVVEPELIEQASHTQCRRRVAHFEFAVDDLLGGPQWETQRR